MIKIWLRVATDDSFAHFWNGTMTHLQFKAIISIKRLLTLKVCALKLQTDNITAIKLCFWHYLGRTNETEGNFSIYLLKCGGGRTAGKKRPATQYSADYTFLSVENNAALFCRDSSCASLSRARCPLVLRKYSCCEIMVLFVSEKSAFHLQDLGLHPVGTSVFSFPTYFLKFTSTCLFSLVGGKGVKTKHTFTAVTFGDSC